MGGYKSALNVSFLTANSVVLVVNAAPSLSGVMGRRYAERRDRVWKELAQKGVQEIRLDWQDSLGQRLSQEELRMTGERINDSLEGGEKTDCFIYEKLGYFLILPTLKF